MHTRHYALIGARLGHSLSKQLFDSRHFAGADYRLCEMPSLEGLREWVLREGICGFNVTNPYKRAVMPLLDAVDPEAAAIGAVNCVKVSRGRLTGYNTDAPAFRQTLENTLNTEHLTLNTEHLTLNTEHLTLNTKHLTLNTALILGTGGAARAVAHALGRMGIDYTFVSRHPERLKVKGERLKVISYAELPAFTSHLSPLTLLINATPVGMWPDVDASPLPPDFHLSPFTFHLVYDLIYNPSPTLLLRQAAERGAKTVDGMAMLRRQAELSWEIFFRD